MEEVFQPISLGRQSVIEIEGRSEVRSSSQLIARILERVVFYGLLAVISLTAIPYGTVEPWWVAVFECLVFFLGILGTIEALISKYPRANSLSLFAPLIVLALFIWFQSLPLFSSGDMKVSLSADPQGSRLVVVKLLSFIVAGALLLRYASTKNRIRALVFTVIGMGVATAVFGLVRKNIQSGPTFFLSNLPLDDRNFGQFINKNHFAFLVEMALGLTLALLLMAVKHRCVVLLLPIAALLWVALVISNSRGGVLGSLCQLLFLVVMIDPVKHLLLHHFGGDGKRLRAAAVGFMIRGLLLACLIALFGYGVAWIGGERVVVNFRAAASGFSESGNPNNAQTSRRQMWAMTWQMFKDRPFTGVGFGAYWIGVTKYHGASGELTPQQAHNDYLDLLAAGGLFGGALVIWFAIIFVSRVREQLRSQDAYRRAVCLGALTGIFGVAIHSFVDFGLHITVNALVFVALIVIATASIRPQQAPINVPVH